MEENKKQVELKDEDLEKATGGISVYSDEGTITMYFSTSENPSEKLTTIKNKIQDQLGCFLCTDVSNTLQGLLNDMSNNGKTYLKINYTKDGEFITAISVNTLF